MVDTQKATRAPRRLVLLTAAAALLALSSAAKAQGLFSFPGDGPQRYEIERRLEAGGYALTRPLIARGDVYLADVAVVGGAERLVIDMETGRIVERYRLPQATEPNPAARAWDRDDADAWDAPPRPPAELGRWTPDAAPDLPAARQDLPEARQARPALTRQLALGDDAAPPTVITGHSGARATSHGLIETPKAKPLDAKRKAATPAPPSAPSASAAPAAVTAPAVATAPAASGAVGASPAPPPQAARAAQADAPANAAAAKPPPSAETPAAPAPAKTKAVNDVPVTPLD